MEHFELVLDEATISLVNFDSQQKPSWTKLAHQQCACCPLNATETPYCPIAVNIAALIDQFKNRLSVEKSQIKCITPERAYLKETSVTDGLYSILGIVMATSDCPVMSFYKPMARFHLPFASTQETLFRSISVYLLQQYFDHKRGRKLDLELQELDKQMKRVQQVNAGMLARIKSITQKDADNNAIIILDSFSRLLSIEIEDSLSSLEYLFPQQTV